MLINLRSRVIVAASACVAYAAVFAVFLVLERPGLGIGHFFYVPVLLIGLAGGWRVGVVGGLTATALYAAGVVLNPSIPPTDVPTVSTAIRLVTYAIVGGAFGWFAGRSRASHETLRILAERDFLTGSLNARAFEDAARRRLQRGKPFSIVLADMDGLKRINDTRGHPEGDKAIQRAAQVICSTMRADDDVARMGGDEFAVLADVTGSAAAKRLADRLEEEAAAAGVPLTVGWAAFPVDGEDIVTLYRAADAMLYVGKSRVTRARMRPRLAG